MAMVKHSAKVHRAWLNNLKRRHCRCENILGSGTVWLHPSTGGCWGELESPKFFTNLNFHTPTVRQSYQIWQDDSTWL